MNRRCGEFRCDGCSTVCGNLGSLIHHQNRCKVYKLIADCEESKEMKRDEEVEVSVEQHEPHSTFIDESHPASGDGEEKESDVISEDDTESLVSVDVEEDLIINSPKDAPPKLLIS